MSAHRADTPLDHLLTREVDELPPVPDRPSAQAVEAGVRVAQQWAAQDRLDPRRPTLAHLVTDEVARIERRSAPGRRVGDVADDALRARLRDTIAQREALRDERVKVAQRHIEQGNLAAAGHELLWAGHLGDEATALRVLLA